jgi:hypothetical protein
MAKQESKPMQRGRKIALNLPEVEEGTSCNKSAFQVRKKSFCFMGQKDDSYNVMVKLVDSLPEAEKLQTDSPERFKVGLHGWTTLIFPHSESPPSGLLEKWIVESYRTLVHKQLVALLSQETAPAGGFPKGASAKKKKTVRRKTVRKKRSPEK